MIQDLLSQIKAQMKKTLEHLEAELMSVRTGRANSALVEGVEVTYYGSKVPIKQVATIQVPDATSLLIQPWDPKALGDIEQGIRESGIGLQPTNDGRTIRISIPPLTTERRAELVKLLHKMGEDARVSLRSIRKDAWEEVQKEQKAGTITEDDKFRTEEQLNKVIDDFNGQIEQIIKQKESDILTV